MPIDRYLPAGVTLTRNPVALRIAARLLSLGDIPKGMQQIAGVASASSLLKTASPTMKTSFPRKRESSKPLICLATKILGSRIRGSDERISTDC